MSNPTNTPFSVPSFATLTTGQPEQAIQFYEQLFHWKSKEQAGAATESYTLLQNGAPQADIQIPAGKVLQKWRMGIDVVDLAATAEKITTAGGHLVHGPIAGQAEQTAIYADSLGVEFCIRQGGQQPAASAGQPGQFVWTELITDDVEAAHRFYQAVFGWTLSEPITGDPSGRRNWLLHDQPIAGLLPRPVGMPKEIPPYWDVFFSVDDPTLAGITITQLGGSILMPAIDIPHGTIAVFLDATGNIFSLLKTQHQ